MHARLVVSAARAVARHDIKGGHNTGRRAQNLQKIMAGTGTNKGKALACMLKYTHDAFPFSEYMCGREWIWASIHAWQGNDHPVAPVIGDCGLSSDADDPNYNIASLPKCVVGGTPGTTRKEYSVAQVWRDFISDYGFFDSSGDVDTQFSHKLMELISSTYARRTTGFLGEDFDWREKLLEKYTSTLAGAWAPKDDPSKADPTWTAGYPMRPNAESNVFWEHEAFGDGGLTRSACNKILCPGIGFNCADVD